MKIENLIYRLFVQSNRNFCRTIIPDIISNFKGWPWQIAIVENGKTICGGVLISQTKILTAAHCIVHKDIFVVLNDYHSEIEDYNEKIIKPTSVEIHPKFSRSKVVQHDLAIIRFMVR